MKTLKEIIDSIEKELKPEYMNDIFTWKEIVDVIIKVTRPNNLQSNVTLEEFLKSYPRSDKFRQETKSFKDICDKIAKKYGCNNWDEMVFDVVCENINDSFFKEYEREAAELYSEQNNRQLKEACRGLWDYWTPEGKGGNFEDRDKAIWDAAKALELEFPPKS